jgi:hypothetical protein
MRNTPMALQPPPLMACRHQCDNKMRPWSDGQLKKVAAYIRGAPCIIPARSQSRMIGRCMKVLNRQHFCVHNDTLNLMARLRSCS